MSLDEADNHLPTFLLYLIAAIEEGLPNCCTEVQQLVQARQTPSIESLAGMLVNRLGQRDESILLVLDDLHLIRENAVFVFLARLIEYAPPQLHLVLISRVDPPAASQPVARDPPSARGAAARPQFFSGRDNSLLSNQSGQHAAELVDRDS